MRAGFCAVCLLGTRVNNPVTPYQAEPNSWQLMQVLLATAACDVAPLVPLFIFMGLNDVKLVFEWQLSHGVLPDGTCAF